MLLTFIGIDGWDRAVFKSEDGNFHKSVFPLYEGEEVVSADKWDAWLENMHTTDSFDGEPGYPVPRASFQARA